MPLAEHDALSAYTRRRQGWFQFTCPSRSTTSSRRCSAAQSRVSIHVPLAEHDEYPFCMLWRASKFQFTCPSRSTTFGERWRRRPKRVSIHVPLAEHDKIWQRWQRHRRVSIHVPLAEHDLQATNLFSLLSVSIHVPLAEHDAINIVIAINTNSFNSRAPRGARLHQRLVMMQDNAVSIHVPLAEHDINGLLIFVRAWWFQFTCPSRSTTHPFDAVLPSTLVSIHVPLAEHDLCAAVVPLARAGFNSRAPRGARRGSPKNPDCSPAFQFTCPSRSTTYYYKPEEIERIVSIHVPLAEHDGEVWSLYPAVHGVSIHVPLAEHDGRRQLSGTGPHVFQFTCPSRSTTFEAFKLMMSGKVSIHVPLAEHDLPPAGVPRAGEGFNSRAPRGARLSRGGNLRRMGEFQFTCPSRSTTSFLAYGDLFALFQFTCPSRSTTVSYPILPVRVKFQFTCPSRSTTCEDIHAGQYNQRFNSRAPRGARRVDGLHAACCRVSIHVPLAEHDHGYKFNDIAITVSIHVPLAEHDGLCPLWTPDEASFQFTCPSRSTTASHATSADKATVSIHVPLAEHDILPRLKQ